MLRLLLTLLLALQAVYQEAAAADFYRGKTVTLLVTSAVGGGYDAMSRTVARHLGDHLPGHPVIIVDNMPGAGGIQATNYLYNRAPHDGTVIGGIQNNTPFEPLLGTPQARYDATKFIWLGSPSVETGLVAVWHAVPVNTIGDLKTREITVASSGANSTPSFYTRLLNATLGTKMRLIVGYPGQNDSFLAMERGEVDGYPSIFYHSLVATKPDWLRDKKLKLLLQYGPAKEPALAGVPFVMDLVTKPEDRALLQAGFAALALGRPYIMPPGVPADRVALMRKAFADTFNDPKFQAEATKMGLGATQPRSGEELQKIVVDAYRASPQIIARLRQLNASR